MKASKRRARARRSSKSAAQPQPQPIVQPDFSEVEEAFFQEGAALSAAASSDALDTFADLDARRGPPPSLWRRLFAWVQRDPESAPGAAATDHQ